MVTCVADVCSVISRGVGETHDDGADVDNNSGSEGGARIEHVEVREVGPEADVPADHNLVRAMANKRAQIVAWTWVSVWPSWASRFRSLGSECDCSVCIR